MVIMASKLRDIASIGLEGHAIEDVAACPI